VRGTVDVVASSISKGHITACPSVPAVRMQSREAKMHCVKQDVK
jgi:hypothetical protein